MEFLVISLLLMLAIMAIFQPMLGLYAFFIVAYIRPQDFYPSLIGVEPAKWILLITFISFLFHMLNSQERFVKNKQLWAMLGILLMILASRFKAIDTEVWRNNMWDFIRIIIACFILINTLTDTKKLKHFVTFYILINLFVALRFYISYKNGTAVYWGSRPGDLSRGFLGNADDLGLGMVVALAYSFVPIFYSKNIFMKGIFVLISGCFMMAALVTGSRGAHLGIFTVFVTAIILNLNFKKLRKSKYAIGIIIALIMVTLFVFKFRYTLQGSYDSMQVEDDSGKIGRMATWAAAKQMIKDSPIIGIGRGNFVQYWRANYPSGVYGYQVAHNILYEVASEIGLVGMLFFLFFSLYGLVEIIKIRRNHKLQLEEYSFLDMIFAIYIVGLAGFYVNGMFITVAFYWHIYILVAIFVSAKSIFMKESLLSKNEQ